ncbi:trehalase-like [Glossophaga mutica]
MVPNLGPSSGHCLVSTCWCQAEWSGLLHTMEHSRDSGLPMGASSPVKPEVLRHPERFSLIYSQHPFTVPGGHFLEFYYWDSYWVMEGLLLSEMPKTVKGMLQNFLDLVQIYGHVPSGARVYYLQCSQPPLLTLMMDRYVTYTNNTAFLWNNTGTLALELDFWTKNRNISVSLGGKSYILNRYYVPYGGPR